MVLHRYDYREDVLNRTHFMYLCLATMQQYNAPSEIVMSSIVASLNKHALVDAPGELALDALEFMCRQLEQQVISCRVSDPQREKDNVHIRNNLTELCTLAHTIHP
jgi:hypothetical protein